MNAFDDLDHCVLPSRKKCHICFSILPMNKNTPCLLKQMQTSKIVEGPYFRSLLHPVPAHNSLMPPPPVCSALKV